MAPVPVRTLQRLKPFFFLLVPDCVPLSPPPLSVHQSCLYFSFLEPTLACAHSHTHVLSYTYTLTHSRTHSYTYTRTHSYTHTLLYIHSHAHSYTYTLAHTHTPECTIPLLPSTSPETLRGRRHSGKDVGNSSWCGRSSAGEFELEVGDLNPFIARCPCLKDPPSH